VRTKRNRRLSNLFLFSGTPLSARFDRPDPPVTDDLATGAAALGAGGGVSKDVVTLSKAEYAEFVAAKAERDGLKPETERLRGIESDAKMMLRGDLDPAAKAEPTRRMLLNAGYTKEQIDAYLNPKGPAPKGKVDDDETPLEDPNDGRLKQLEEQNKQILNHQQNQELTRMKGLLETSAGFSMADTSDKNGMGVVVARLKANAKAILDAAREGDPAELASAQETANGMLNLEGEIKNQIRERTTARLQYRRQQTGQWSDSWFAEEATKAAAELAKVYRPLVIEYPNRLGRASGTESGEDVFRNVKPVEAPVYKPGMNNANAKAAVTDWAADLLGRASAELSRETSAV